MDLSYLLLHHSPSISSNIQSIREISTIQSRSSNFFATYQLQEFSLSDSIMFYLTKNPTSPELYEKMVQTCKDFFVKNPILVIPEFDYSDGSKWRFPFSRCRIDLLKIASKLWITDRLLYSGYSGKNKDVNLLSSLMPKFYQCNAKFVSLSDQIISFHDLSRLLSSAKKINLHNVTVKDENGLNVAVEKIVIIAVKAKKIEIQPKSESLLNVTSNTMKELLMIPHFSKLCVLTMAGIPEAFDLKTFFDYVKQNKTTKIYLHFHDSISEVYKNRLVEIVDEIIANKNRDYKPPYFMFDGFDEAKSFALFILYDSH